MRVNKNSFDGTTERTQVVGIPKIRWQRVLQTECTKSTGLLTDTLLVQWVM